MFNKFNFLNSKSSNPSSRSDDLEEWIIKLEEITTENALDVVAHLKKLEMRFRQENSKLIDALTALTSILIIKGKEDTWKQVREVLLADDFPVKADEPCITMYVCTPGGEVSPTLAIVDSIRALAAPIQIIGVGEVASAGCWVIASGQKDRRLSFPHTRFFIHDMSVEYHGKAKDTKSWGKEVVRRRKLLARMLAEFTEQPIKKILKLMREEVWLTAKEAIELGLIDRIIQP